ncbi:MocR-like pyridoxine biosynthesis transcription factor PdxR [Fuchsiella alkaliacetigena]|uniref:MocR-like pyridoxine biosynthesis transcription factor PdxR n=1 Tax=Fuchsiella alkaliacetigena TaxID=957042 RepID=UPI00200AB45A|nr:PLP-dependent aminotransferase family protein [Fuchsiella alkaliacetigena]MCK8824931.1 PLP-dependent aminotransferase family protein [Fuchsiella alkaliacetigena]
MIDLLSLDKNSSTHLYIQLAQQLKKLIKEEKIAPHTKLPPIRKLAQKLDINNVTVVKAYDLLAAENTVYKKVGSGTFVAPKLEVDNESPHLDEEVYIDEDSKFDQQIINFATAAPSPELFPVQTFKKLLNKVLDRDKGYAFGYQKSQGYLPLRESISNYLQNYEIQSTAQNIQIVSGAQQGIDILAKTFLDYGDSVLVEEPSYPGALSVFKAKGAQLIEVPIEKDGIKIAELEKKLNKSKPKFLYLMPNFQNPTGYSYSKKKMEKILDLAAEYNLLIIEDDCLNDLNYSSKPTLPLKALDNSSSVIYLKSFSKVFMPGLRLAFLIIPPEYLEDILLSKYISDIFTDGLVQRVLDLYFRQEIWTEQLDYLQQTYQHRYEVMVKSLKNHLPKEVSFITPQGGLNIWLKLPDTLTMEQLYNRALGAGVKIATGDLFYSQQPCQNRIRLSFAAVEAQQIKNGIEKLAKIIKDLLTKNNDILPPL